MRLNPQNDPIKAIKQTETTVVRGFSFLVGRMVCRRLVMANSAVYWLVKIANRMINMVMLFGTAVSNGIDAWVVFVVLIVDKIKPSRIVTQMAVSNPAQTNVWRGLFGAVALISSGNMKQFKPAYRTAQNNAGMVCCHW